MTAAILFEILYNIYYMYEAYLFCNYNIIFSLSHDYGCLSYLLSSHIRLIDIKQVRLFLNENK